MNDKRYQSPVRLVCRALLFVSITLNQAHAAEPPTEPQDYRNDNYRSPVPATLKGTKVLKVEDAAELWAKKQAVFIDVYPHAPKPANLPAGTFWREPVHQSIEGAIWLPNVGYGGLSEVMENAFKGSLDRLTKGDRDQALVFFCLRDCWMSWNAAKRALTYGYRNIMWFADGTDAWQEHGMPVEDVKPDPAIGHDSAPATAP